MVGGTHIQPNQLPEHIRVLKNFLSGDGFLSEYQDYVAEMQEENSVDQPPDPGSVRKDGPEKPLFHTIYSAEKSFHQYQQTGELGLTDQVLDTFAIGRALKLVNQISVVDPDGNPIPKSLKQTFRDRLLAEENYWDSIFELEMAAIFANAGFDVCLIEEDETGGPDILLNSDSPVWVECKRKRGQTARENEFQKFREETTEQFWRNVDLGPDNFVVVIEGDDEFEEYSPENISKGLEYVVKNREPEARFQFDNRPIEIDLLDYVEGEMVIEPDKTDPLDPFDEGGQMANNIVSNLSPSPAGEFMDANPFANLELPSLDEGLGEANASVKFNEDGELVVRNAFVIAFKFDNNLTYWNGIHRSFESARGNLSDYCPSVAIVDIPAGRWEKMQNSTCQFNGEEVSETKRIEISQKGILKQNSSINALTITARYSNHEQDSVNTGRVATTMLQEYPEEPLPDEVKNYLDFSFE